MDEKELYECVIKIREFCEEQTMCACIGGRCPFSDTNGGCALAKQPVDWYIERIDT